MKCKKCGISTKKHEFCDKCFLSVIYKRLRKSIRSESYLKNQSGFIVIDELTMKVLPNLINKPVDIEFKKTDFNDFESLKSKELDKLMKSAKKNKQKLILPLCLDDFEIPYLKSLFIGKKTKISLPALVVPLFLPLTKEEFRRLGKLNQVKIRKMKKNLITNFLDKFEKEFPGVKFNIKKSFDISISK